MIRGLLIAATRFLVGGQGIWVGSRPEAGSRVYFANHASHMDTLLIWAALPAELRVATHPVAAADYWGRGRVRRYIALRVLNAILLDRQAKARAPGGPLGPAKEKLEAGRSLIIFPEGTRSPERLPGPFKPGLYHLAEEFPDVALIPVYLDNLGRAFPKGSLIPVPISCVARFGAQIMLEKGETREQFLTRARDAVIALS